MSKDPRIKSRAIARPGFHEYFMAVAKLTAVRSTCSSRPVGCVIVKNNRILSTGYNGPPSGYPHCIDKNTSKDIFCARRDSNVSNDEKYKFCKAVHAEVNAIDIANQFSIDLTDSTVYVTLSPCINCIRRMRMEGITHVYYELEYESCNKDKDAEWISVGKNSFSTFESLILTASSRNKLGNIFNDCTSSRLLASV